MTKKNADLTLPLRGYAGLVLAAAFAAIALLAACTERGPEPGTVLDEAKQAGRTAESFAHADEDYFHDMDGAPTLTPEEIKGRNTWIVWTGGNDRMWDVISRGSFGSLDFLKIVSSYPNLKFSRDNRWQYLGLVNEPCFEKATGPDPNRFGLWLDQRRADCPPDPFENEQKYPGVKIGARGKNIPVGSAYGYATGIVGLRLFPNPDFDEAAAKKWDAKRYYEDPKYALSKDLVKPYRVGMSCGFCHVGPNPVNPPADPEHPQWANLSSNVGAQYMWFDRVFAWEADETSFVFQLFHSARPGTLDTSLIPSDNINNPRTMNAVYELKARLLNAKQAGQEKLAGGSLNNRQFNDYVKEGLLTEFFRKPDTVWTPRVLKSGEDSVGALGALNRVFINIGLFSEEWFLHFKPLVGGKRQSPIEIAVARKNSTYWEATEAQTPDMALFFLKTTGAHKLKDAPGGTKFLAASEETLNRGKTVFAENCLRCHSSKRPTPPADADPGACAGAGYMGCWNRYWDWTKTDAYKAQARELVAAPDFLDGNFLSSEYRVPVTLLQTNACSPMASNAIANNIWDNFSSQSYKDLPAVGPIVVNNPITGEARTWQPPAGGRGYTRPASLVSLWSTAPFLLNNSVGKFEESPAVDARMASFQDSIEKMLWPEKRDKDPVLGDKVPGVIDRTRNPSYLRVPVGFLPDELQELQGPLHRFLPWLFGAEGVEIGPIPTGTPVALLSNLQLVADNPDPAHTRQVIALLLKLKGDLKALPKDGGDEAGRKVFANAVGPLLELSKCPDFVVNRGHYFGTGYTISKEGRLAKAGNEGLSDDDKRALIEYLKTF